MKDDLEHELERMVTPAGQETANRRHDQRERWRKVWDGSKSGRTSRRVGRAKFTVRCAGTTADGSRCRSRSVGWELIATDSRAEQPAAVVQLRCGACGLTDQYEVSGVRRA